MERIWRETGPNGVHVGEDWDGTTSFSYQSRDEVYEFHVEDMFGSNGNVTHYILTYWVSKNEEDWVMVSEHRVFNFDHIVEEFEIFMDDARKAYRNSARKSNQPLPEDEMELPEGYMYDEDGNLIPMEMVARRR